MQGENRTLSIKNDGRLTKEVILPTPSPSQAPANNGMHTVRRNPNGGLYEIEERESFSEAKDACKGDPAAERWLRAHEELWVPRRGWRGRRR